MNRHNLINEIQCNMHSSGSASIEQTTVKSTNETSIFMGNMTEHERMLQSILTNEVDPQHIGVVNRSDIVNVELEATTPHSNSELEQNGTVDVTEKGLFENAVVESKRLIQVLCIWC